MRVQYVEKGSYLFRKGERGDNAYLIMHGQVNFLTLSHLNWLGSQPNAGTTKELDTAQIVRYVSDGSDGMTQVECENVVVTFDRGRLFGEIALMDPK